MKPDGEADEGLGQAEHLRAQPTVGGEDKNQVHEEQEKVEDVAKSLEDLEADVRWLRSSVEKLERLQSRDERGQAEDCEVDGEINLDEDEELLEGEIGFDSVKDKRD